MSRFVVTAGFKTEKIVRPVVGYGPDPDSTVQLLVPAEDDPPDPRQQAIANARETLSMVGGDALTVEVVDIDCTTFERTLVECLSVLGGPTDDDLPVVCLAGGVTDLVLPLILATMVRWPWGVKDLRYYSELQSTGADCTFPDLMTDIPGRTRETFAAVVILTGYLDQESVSSGDSALLDLDTASLAVLGGRINSAPPDAISTTTIDTVAEETDQSAATVSRHAGTLADNNLLTIYQGEQRNHLAPSMTGLLHQYVGAVS